LGYIYRGWVWSYSVGWESYCTHQLNYRDLMKQVFFLFLLIFTCERERGCYESDWFDHGVY
jgi:hypothetical protein